jgi:gamma-glutamyltranspeptidase/glutathione hydrolase
MISFGSFEAPVRRSATGTSIVTTAFPAATEAGAVMLRAGGNAVDAAVAAGWALSVCEPSGSGIGGQGTLLIGTSAGDWTVLDGHSHAPSGLTRANPTREQQRRGHRACTVPSLPRTLDEAHRRYGRLSRATVMAPAIALAAEGFEVSKMLRRHVSWCRGALAASPFTASLFLPEGKPIARGSLLRQPQLAATLERMSVQGVEDFYEGQLARAIADDMAHHGGLVTLEDLAGLHAPVERTPLSISYRGHEVMTAPPPGGGVQVLLGLRLAEALGLHELPGDDPAWYERMATVIHTVFRDRARWPMAPEDLTPSVVSWMLGRERAQELVAHLKERAVPVRSAEGPGDTTHLCVADADGMVVSMTQSIQSLFGAKVANPELGFFYNNYLCTCARGRHPNRLGPGALPQSNLAPTVVFRSDSGARRDPFLVLGAAGSRRITSSILHVLTRTLDQRMDIDSAVAAPRVHATLSGNVMVEAGARSESLDARLALRFPGQVIPRAHHSFSLASVQAMQRGDDGRWTGSADPRREGVAHGI